MYSIPVGSRNSSALVDGAIIVWGVLEQPYSGVIPPNSRTVLSLLTIGGNLPAAGYSASVSVQTTQPMLSVGLPSDPTLPVTLASGFSFTISWSINVLQALVFPPQQNVHVVPNQTVTVLNFAVANFAGSPLQVLPISSTLPSWMALSLESNVVQNGNMVDFNVTVVYPSVVTTQQRRMSDVCIGRNLPNAVGPDVVFNESLSFSAWRLPPGTTPQSLALVDESMKISVPLQNVTIAVTTMLGPPSSLYSCVAPPGISNCTVGDVFGVLVEVRDVGGTLLPFSSSVTSSIGISVSCEALGACKPILSGTDMADIINVANTTDEAVYLVEIQVLSSGPLLIQVRISEADVGQPFAVYSFGITCPTHQLTLDGSSCICAAGYYLDFTGNGTGTACFPCALGTYNPSVGSVGNDS